MENTEKIKEKIELLQKELDEYRRTSQEKINDAMQKSGITAFIADVNSQIAYFQGKIDSLKELLPDSEKVVVLKDK